MKGNMLGEPSGRLGKVRTSVVLESHLAAKLGKEEGSKLGKP